MGNETNRLFNQPFDSLDDFADAISERLHCPVTIEDSNHHYLLIVPMKMKPMLLESLQLLEDACPNVSLTAFGKMV